MDTKKRISKLKDNIEKYTQKSRIRNKEIYLKRR